MSDAEPAAEPEPEPAAEGGVEQVEASESADGPWAPTEDALAHVAALDATRVAAQSQSLTAWGAWPWWRTTFRCRWGCGGQQHDETHA